MGILIENLSFHYTGTPVLDQVNLEVKDGDYAILTGENGSGKSTFLKLLLGELKAQEGSITVNGKDISATFGKGDLGYVPQNSISRNQNFPATVEEIMMTGVYSSSWKARFRAKKEIPRLKAALAEMEMADINEENIMKWVGPAYQLQKAILNPLCTDALFVTDFSNGYGLAERSRELMTIIGNLEIGDKLYVGAVFGYHF